MLLKVALLLGVDFKIGCQFLDATESGGGVSGWHAKIQAPDGDVSKIPFDVLVGADGANSVVPQLPGVSGQFGRTKLGLKKNSAIGLVANFVGRVPSNLRQFSWARQYAGEKFAELERQTGLSLENIVYYRSGGQHYVVMTPTPSSLISKGIVKDANSANLVGSGNINRDALKAAAMEATAHFGLPSLDFAPAPNDVSLFDFSGTTRAQQSCAFLRAGSSVSMVALAGDALLEPFWPEGLGIMRGFMSTLDTVAAINAWAGSNTEKATKLASETFSVLKSLNGQSASNILARDFTKYDVDPATRYR
jgi:hypothetical protein